MEQILNKIFNELTNINEKITSLDNRLSNVEDRLSSVEDRLSNVEDRLSSVEDDLSIVKIQLEENTQMIKAVRDNQLVQRSEHDAVIHKLANIEANGARQEKILERLSVRSIEHETDIKELQRVRHA